MARRIVSYSLWAMGVWAWSAAGSVISVPHSAFPLASTVVDFSLFPIGTDLNDIALPGISFSYTIKGVPERGVIEIEGGPGNTNNITGPSAVSTGDSSGTVIVDLSGSANLLGYGYSLLTFGGVNPATTISLFRGSTFIDSMTYAAVPDPLFAGGFAGIQSTDGFDHVEITFNANAAPAFALNQLVLSSAPSEIPEPAAILLVFTGISAIFFGQYLRPSAMTSISLKTEIYSAYLRQSAEQSDRDHITAASLGYNQGGAVRV